MLIRSFAAARLVFVALAILALSADAKAQVLTFVTATGNDTNTCLVEAAPCKTLQRAINATTANGEVRLLSSLTGVTGSITKSITINGGGNTVFGTISINSAGAIVSLRGLSLTGRGAAATGINIVSAAAVHIADCTIERYAGNGIKLVASTAIKLFVSDTDSGDNAAGGIYVNDDNAQVMVDNSRFENNAGYGLYLRSATANVTRSIASGNGGSGILVWGGTANVTETAAADNSGFGFHVYGGELTLASSVARGNGIGLNVASGAAAVVTDSVFTRNVTGIYNGGTLATRENNTLVWNLYSGNEPEVLVAF